MGENSAIQWTDHTFNPWWGCVKVSEGCQNCYAETLAKRTGHDIWGPAATTERRTFGDAHWAEPLKWNAAAAKAGERHRVFSASMADVFEDNLQLEPERRRLWQLIYQTPSLDWLLLTKRPENLDGILPLSWLYEGMPANLWLGTSVENQEQADKRIPELLAVPATVRFLSCEPLLGPVDLTPYMGGEYLTGIEWSGMQERGYDPPGIQWVIVGGESGPQARPMHPDWARDLRDQCQAHGVPFLFKQWGQWLPASQRPDNWCNSGELLLSGDKETPGLFIRVASKHAAGRLLDGREWNEMPGAA